MRGKNRLRAVLIWPLIKPTRRDRARKGKSEGVTHPPHIVFGYTFWGVFGQFGTFSTKFYYVDSVRRALRGQKGQKQRFFRTFPMCDLKSGGFWGKKSKKTGKSVKISNFVGYPRGFVKLPKKRRSFLGQKTRFFPKVFKI